MEKNMKISANTMAIVGVAVVGCGVMWGMEVVKGWMRNDIALEQHIDHMINNGSGELSAGAVARIQSMKEVSANARFTQGAIVVAAGIAAGIALADRVSDKKRRERMAMTRGVRMTRNGR
jgi:hypothetical protein